ncbi:MAG TPA: hypothetical protein VHS28_06025 [Chloroflexota bacterium]|nr:hypothetical protein [Chloroflexota bacterium]
MTLEVGLYLLALLVGMILRLLLIDARPLSFEEGALASESYRIWLGQPPESLHQGPLTAFGTALALALFAGGDGAARLVSAIFGARLVGTPFLLRNSLGRTAALVATWGAGRLSVTPVRIQGRGQRNSAAQPGASPLGAGEWRNEGIDGDQGICAGSRSGSPRRVRG